jgi:hypothetical protein
MPHKLQLLVHVLRVWQVWYLAFCNILKGKQRALATGTCELFAAQLLVDALLSVCQAMAFPYLLQHFSQLSETASRLTNR